MLAVFCSRPLPVVMRHGKGRHTPVYMCSVERTRPITQQQHGHRKVQDTRKDGATQWEIVAFGVVLGLHLYFEVFVLLVDLLFLSAILLRSSSVVPLTDTVRASNFD